MVEMMVGNARVVLVTGPSRSGKSEWAETLSSQCSQQVAYVATAQDYPDDMEWQERIQLHQQRRPSAWQTIHCPMDLAQVISSQDASVCLLIDSLGTWIANFMEQNESEWQSQVEALLEAIQSTPAMLIFVSEETGWGLVPAYPEGRLFRDRLGSLSRAVAQLADEVYLVSVGIAVNLKQIGHIVPSSSFRG